MNSSNYNFFEEFKRDFDKGSISYFYYVQTPLIFVNFDHRDEALKIINLIASSQTIEGDFVYENQHYIPTYFLYSLLALSYDHKLHIKSFKKVLRRSLLYLEQNFDETYLLFNSFNNSRFFSIYDQIVFLSCASQLSDVLNDIGLSIEADRIAILKGKVELGIKRYMVQKNSLLLNFNLDSKTFEFCSKNKILEICSFLREDLFEEFDVKHFLKNNDFESLLQKVQYFECEKYFLKSKGELDKYFLNFIKCGATELISKKDWVNHKRIYTSLFFEEPQEIKVRGSKLKGVSNSQRISLLIELLRGDKK